MTDEEIIPAGTQIDSGAVLVERVLYDILRYGFAQIKSDPSLVDDLFSKYDLATRTDIKAYLSSHTVAVKENFPPDELTLPLVAVLNSSESESQGNDLLDDELMEVYDNTTNTPVDVVGHAVQGNFQIFCVAQRDSNAALWLYYIVKALLIINRDELQLHGLHNIVMNGADIALRDDLFPEKVFSRTLTVSCLYHFSISVTQKVGSQLHVRIFTEDVESGTTTLVTAEDV